MRTPSALIRRLATLRGDFSLAARKEQALVLRLLTRSRPDTSRQLIELHRELLFVNAFPADEVIWRSARKMLEQFHTGTSRRRGATSNGLMDSGIAGSTSLHTFMFGTVQWLASCGETLEPHWSESANPDVLDLLIRGTLLPAEWDAYDDGTDDAVSWLRLAAGSRAHGGGLSWLVRQSSVKTMRAEYDAAELPVAWHTGNSARTVTRNCVPPARPTLRRSFRRLPGDVVALINGRPGRIQRLTQATTEKWLDCCRAALVARCREVAPTIYPNAAELYLCDLGEGCAMCVIGAHPDDRLALEANYGYVLFSNGIPIGYGGVTPLADQANTGLNIFEEFRGSEAALLFAHALRAFRALFGISRFVVNPYQFGAANDEALLSGAFWMYDRLGFRAATVDTRAAVRTERDRLRDRPGARSSLRTLKRFAATDLILDLKAPDPLPQFNELHLPTIGRHVATLLSGVDAGQRRAHVLTLARQHMFTLTGRSRALTSSEQRGAILLAPIVELIRESLPRWGRDDRAKLWAIVGAKGALRERQFVHLSRRHRPFWHALTMRCATGADQRPRRSH